MTQNKNETLTQIARDAMNVSTLETRGRDALDFHDLSAATIAVGLSRAFDAGAASASVIAPGTLDQNIEGRFINAEVSARDLAERVAYIAKMLRGRVTLDAGELSVRHRASSIRHTLAGIARDAAELNAALAAIEVLESLTPNPGA